MTPNDILNKQFSRAAVGGYRTDDVNSFLLSISDYLEELQADKNDLEKKLIVLAEKLEEYRSDEESMRSAILGAQKLGDKIISDSKESSDQTIQNAEKEADEIVSNAKNEATKITHEAKLKVETEAYALNKLQREVAKFKKQILALYQRQIELIGAIPYDEEDLAPALPNPLRTNIVRTQQEIEFKEKNKMEDNAQDSSILEIEDEQQEKPQEINFKPLEFGDGFKVTEKE